MKILLCCSAGMSTSLLVKKIASYARDVKGAEIEVTAVSISEAKTIANDWDVILVGPQVSFALNEIKAVTTKPVDVIPPQIYALAKGKETFELAEKLINEQ